MPLVKHWIISCTSNHDMCKGQGAVALPPARLRRWHARKRRTIPRPRLDGRAKVAKANTQLSATEWGFTVHHYESQYRRKKVGHAARLHASDFPRCDPSHSENGSSIPVDRCPLHHPGLPSRLVGAICAHGSNICQCVTKHLCFGMLKLPSRVS